MGIYISFFIYIILFIVNLLLPVPGTMTHTNRMWLIMDAYVLIISIALLIKIKLPSKKRIALSVFLGALMFLAYQGISFSSVKGFITVTLCSMASFSVFEQYPAHAAAPVTSTRFPSVAVSLLIALAVGAVLGVINLGLGGQPLNFNLTLSCFLIALSPAMEEICYRLILFAFCLFLLKGKIRNRSDNFWCYFMMVVPHVLLHIPDVILSYGLISGIVNAILLSMLFGVPFAVLIRKRDLLSAMTAHGIVDVIRFAFFGLPF